MTDMLQTIIPKSDQMNFDDFAAGQSKTIKVTKVTGVAGDQPISIHYDADDIMPEKIEWMGWTTTWKALNAAGWEIIRRNGIPFMWPESEAV